MASIISRCTIFVRPIAFPFNTKCLPSLSVRSYYPSGSLVIDFPNNGPSSGAGTEPTLEIYLAKLHSSTCSVRSSTNAQRCQYRRPQEIDYPFSQNKIQFVCIL